MELNVLTQTVHSAQTILDTAAENAFDLDIRLPEYYPDIQRILKCTVTPNLQSVGLSADRINAEGSGILRMLYASEDKEIVSFEQTFPISKSVQLPNAPQDTVVTACARTDFVNCRASGQRRAGVHGVVSVHFEAKTTAGLEMITGAEDNSMQLRRVPVQALDLAACAERSFSMSEVVELEEEQPAISRILRAHSLLRTDAVKAVQDKLLIKGEVLTEVLYSAEAPNTLYCFRHAMPLSQIVEAVGITENNVQDVSLHVRSLETTPKADGNGEMRLLEIALRVSAFVRSFAPVQIDAVRDAYSTSADLQTQYKQLPFCTCAGQLEDSVSAKQTFDLAAAGITKLLDVSCTELHRTFRTEADTAIVDCTANLLFLYLDADGNPAVTEKQMEFTHRKILAEKAEVVLCTVQIQQNGCKGTLSADGKVEVLMEAQLSGTLYAVREERVLLSCSAEDSAAAKDSAALTIYFTDAGETVWDIAQKYKTTVDAVLAENDLSEETIREKRLLIIPTA